MGKFDYKKWIIEHKYGIINEQTRCGLCGDVNGDGQITTQDASMILNWIVGNIDEFPGCSVCSNFETSIPASINEFCTKCETNSWMGSGFEQYCECCPQSQPEKGPGKIPSRRIRKLR